MTFSSPRKFALALVFLASLPFLRGDVQLPAIFSDSAVLQQRTPVAVWGAADPDEKVTVEFAGNTVRTTAAADGTWKVRLPSMPASKEPRTLTVHGQNTIVLRDILVGEVWLCSGQSNMEKPFGERKGQKPTANSAEEMAAANHPLLRLYQVPHFGKPKEGTAGLRWLRSTPENLETSDFSAAGYIFGRDLLQKLDVPIGIIHASFGGTQIEAWTPRQSFEADEALRPLLGREYHAWVKGVQATELFESTLSPLIPYSLQGFIWYQGEANVINADDRIYARKMEALISGWRSAWGRLNAPFYYVLLAPFDYSRWDSFPKKLSHQALPVVWEAQIAALKVPRTGLISAQDLAPDYKDIHPVNKVDVGHRLAALALADTYKVKPALTAQSPRLARVASTRNGRVTLKIDYAGDGLKTRDGAPPTHFEIAGADGRFFPAQASLRKNRITVSSERVPNPKYVRFSWHETAISNVVNSAGLPLLPFRTDSLPVSSLRE